MLLERIYKYLPLALLISLSACEEGKSSPDEAGATESVPADVPTESPRAAPLPPTGISIVGEPEPDAEISLEGIHMVEYSREGPFPCIEVRGWISAKGRLKLDQTHVQVVATDSAGKPITFQFEPNPDYVRGSMNGARRIQQPYVGGSASRRILMWEFTPRDSAFAEWKVHLPYPFLPQPDSMGNLKKVWLTITAHQGWVEEYDAYGSAVHRPLTNKRSFYRSRHVITFDPQKCEQKKLTVGKVELAPSVAEQGNDWMDGLPDLAFVVRSNGDRAWMSPLCFDDALSGNFSRWPVSFWVTSGGERVEISLIDYDNFLAGDHEEIARVGLNDKVKNNPVQPLILSAPNLKSIEVTYR